MVYTDLEGDEERDQSAGTSRTHPSNWDISLSSTPRHDRRSQPVDTYLDVTVVKVNGNGIITELGDWVNTSKFARPEAVVMPNVGDAVRPVIEKAGFARRISILEPAPALPPAVDEPVATPAVPPAFVGRIEQNARVVVITRLGCLNNATVTLSSGGRSTSEADVVALSAHLEAWATRWCLVPSLLLVGLLCLRPTDQTESLDPEPGAYSEGLQG